MLKTGTIAPTFSFTNQREEKMSLSDFVGKKIIVLYFYPRNFIPGYTVQAFGFMDEYEVFTEHGAEVIRISANSEESHKKFSGSYLLPFHLGADPNGSIRKLYDVPTDFLNILFSRITYIIGLGGKIAWAYKSNLAPASHVPEALKVVKELHTRASR